MVLADAVARLWASLPVPRRPVLVVEDGHWADEDTEAVLEQLAHRAPKAGLSLVITTRPEGTAWRRLQRLAEQRAAVLLRVGPLDERYWPGMAAACLGVPASALPPGLVDRIGPAGGRPLLIEEILNGLHQAGILVRSDRGWTLGPGSGGVPASVEEATRQRLETLPAGDRVVVELAALLGQRMDAGLLARTVPGGLSAVARAARAGTAGGLLEHDPGSGIVVFRHELLRAAVAGSLLDAQRRQHAGRLLGALKAGAPQQPAPATGDSPAWTAALDDDSLAVAARLAAEAGDAALATATHLTAARRLMDRGLPRAAAREAEAALHEPASSEVMEARGLLVEALALAGEVDGALREAARLRAVAAPSSPMARVGEAVARATALRGEWGRAETMLAELRNQAEPPTTTSLAALVALERGRFADAEREAHRVVAAESDGPATCEAIEVLGRLARRTDLGEAEAWFARGVAAAEQRGLALWRARALHELATVAQLRSMDIEPLRQARAAAVQAGAPGLVASVDFHLAAVLGVRFEPEPALATARALLEDARTLGSPAQEAWAWILIGQAHAVIPDRERAQAAGQQAVALAPDDPEIAGVCWATCHGLASLLAEDLPAALQQWQRGVETLRRLPRATPVPPWYLWPLLATVHDLDGDGGLAARREGSAADLRVHAGLDGLWHLAEAVAAGRAGDRDRAQRACDRADERFAQLPAFAGWSHLGRRWAAADAIEAGWGEPAAWMPPAQDWFAARGSLAIAATCRGLARKAGVPQRRRGRGHSSVPAHLSQLGITSREVDVLRLVAEGRTNADIAARLYLSPRTVKGYVEQLLAKTGAANRTQLASRLSPPPASTPPGPEPR